MAEPTLATIKRLFSDAGRVCAFPGCAAPIVGETGAIIGQICHMAARHAGGPRYDPGQSEDERQGYNNLLLLCPTHHRTIDAQPEAFTVDLLQEMKAQAKAAHGGPEKPGDTFFAMALLAKLRDTIISNNRGNIAINSPGAMQAGTIVIKTGRSRPKMAAPVGTIGADGDALRYVKYLIDRYNEFALADPNRSAPFKPAVIYATIKRNYGAKWDLVSHARFAHLTAFLQDRIGKTWLGRIRAASGQALYSTFDEYLHKHRG